MFQPILQVNHHARFIFCLIASVILLSFASSGSAQDQEPVDVIRVRTDLVAVPVSVIDSHRRYVSTLKAEDFVLTDNGQTAKIDYFASGAEHVGLLFAIDVSGSARNIIEQQRSTALALFSRFGSGSRVAVLHFGDFVRLTVPFTGKLDGAEGIFRYRPENNTGTAIFDAAAAAVRSFDGSGGFSTERRIVLLISDGLDTLSSTKYKAVIDAARLRGVSFYVIHFPLFSPSEGRLAPRPPTRGVRELAEQTGGRYFRIGDARSALDPNAKYDLTPVFQAIEDDLKGQYVLGFYPGENARTVQPHLIAVRLSQPRKKFKVNQLKSSYNLKDQP